MILQIDAQLIANAQLPIGILTILYSHVADKEYAQDQQSEPLKLTFACLLMNIMFQTELHKVTLVYISVLYHQTHSTA